MGVPIIIPLGDGSRHDNIELRYLLRSIERNSDGTGDVYVATDCPPEWLQDTIIVPCHDTHIHCKDANLITKTLEVIARYHLQSFVWCCDDYVFTQPTCLDRIPILYNNRSISDFKPGSTWHNRILHTYAWADSMRVRLPYNFESHAPQLFDGAQELARRMQSIPYAQGPGLTIMTAFRVVMGQASSPAIEQSQWKDTFEDDCQNAVWTAKFEKHFAGYNDKAIAAGILERLHTIFPRQSRYEKTDIRII